MLKTNRKKRKISFLSAMLLFCSLLIVICFLCANIVIYTLSTKYEESQYLKNYDLALINLTEIIENKYTDFYILSGKLITNNQINPAIRNFLKVDAEDSISPITRKECFDFLKSLCDYDKYLSGFLIYSSSSNNLHYYSIANNLSYSSNISPEELALIPFQDNIIDVNRANELISISTNEEIITNNFYGFTATIFDKPTEPLGFLIPLYHTNEFENTLSKFNLNSNYNFTITNQDNKLIFSSRTGEKNISSDIYSNSNFDKNNNIIKYIVDKPAWHINSFATNVLLISILLAFLTLILFYITYYLSNKNVENILIGMKEFNLSDLSYRIDPPKSNNEFTQIIIGFNNMCDELQRNVELTYLYELQQKRSELYALQTSINPHFLYNTLEIIRNQINQGDYTNSSKMLLLLSKVHRSQTNTKAFVTIEYDAEICENLMELYQGRFQNFDYEFNIDDDVAQYGIPKNTIQPFIENYYVHGIIPETDDNIISINVSLAKINEKDYIHFNIYNNGKPISKEDINKINEKLECSIYDNSDSEHGFALTNIYKRLRIVFNSECEITVGTYEENKGFKIDITFPACTVKEMEDYIL